MAVEGVSVLDASIFKSLESELASILALVCAHYLLASMGGWKDVQMLAAALELGHHQSPGSAAKIL